MRMLVFTLSFIIMSCFSFVFSNGESLYIIDEITLSADKATYTGREHARFSVTGVYLSGDTTFFSSIVGIIARIPGETGYVKILGREDWSDNWWDDRKTAKEKNTLFFPGQLWGMNGTDDLVVFDLHIKTLYTINLCNRDSIITRFWKNVDKKSSWQTICIYDDLVLYGIISGYHDFILAISHAEMSDYHRVFKCPPALIHKLDSVWAEPYCHPAFNPVDSTIWLAIDYYNYVYIVDMEGDLLDSVHIYTSDFRIPQPPRSRMKSQAVYQDWNSRCTPVRSLWYVPPGYFLLQYRSGWEKVGADSVMLYSTVAWSADRRLVEFEVDKLWSVAGVQPDGRVIFAHYLIEDNKTKEIVLSVARIEP